MGNQCIWGRERWHGMIIQEGNRHSRSAFLVPALVVQHVHALRLLQHDSNTSIARSITNASQPTDSHRTPPAMQHTWRGTPRIGERDPWHACDNGASTWAFYIICLATPSQSFITQLQRPTKTWEAYRPSTSRSSLNEGNQPSTCPEINSRAVLTFHLTGRKNSSTRNLVSAARAHDPALVLTRSAHASTRSIPRAC